MITGCAYLLGGIPVSFFIDKYVGNEKLKFVFYLITGFIVGFITLIIFSLLFSGGQITLHVLKYGLFGCVGAFMFFIFMLLTTKLEKN